MDIPFPITVFLTVAATPHLPLLPQGRSLLYWLTSCNCAFILRFVVPSFAVDMYQFSEPFIRVVFVLHLVWHR